MIKKPITSLLLVYSSSKGLSTGPSLTRLGRLNRKNGGFLLIEIMIALMAVGIFSGVVAFMQGQTWGLRSDARRYLEATALAATYFEHIQLGKKSIESAYTNPFLTLKTKIQKPDAMIPFELHTVTISWKTARGIQQEVSFCSGTAYV